MGWGGVALAAAACLDVGAPRVRPLAFSVIPVFDRYGELAVGADQLRIRIYRITTGPPRDSTQVKDTTVVVDADGTASANINVVLLESSETFRVRLDALESATGAVLFSGSQEVQVTSASSGTSQPVEIPVAWTGPVATRIVIAPKDTALPDGGTFLLRATAFDEANTAIVSSPRFYLVNSADATKLSVNRLTGLVTAVAGQQGRVRVYVETLDPTPPRDTANIYVGAVPNSVRITPGYANVGTGQTLELTGAVLDPIGNNLGLGPISWTSRAPEVALVDASTGVVTGVAPGDAVIVATFTTFSDSIRVTVPVVGNVVVSALGNGRSFRSPAVGDSFQVEVAADMRFTPSEKLGSYNARLTWNTSQLAFVDTVTAVSGDFAAPLVNRDSVASGVLRFAQADPAGKAGAFVLARFRFRAVAQGAAGSAMAITEMSAPSPLFTNLLTRVTVINGAVTVSP
ncbi:MAG: Ig-like domain-containing protein [Gemmatimonadetes bacterium]|nr:Ig-like domain-containing protein [Gemmatimonadota bacterium]